MRKRRGFNLRPVNSIKNVRYLESSTGTTKVDLTLINTVDNPETTASADVATGCNIKTVWISLDFCGLAATGVLQSTTVYLFKNPGSNLTTPIPRTEGTSNEKKFVFKTWNQMTMRNQDGNPPYHWEGWVPIPKRYQRFGTNDLLQMVAATTTAAGHLSVVALFKWYT